jgi:hypothetical protein
MHYMRTNELPIWTLIDIGNRNILTRPDGENELAWVCGYMSHCVVDATVHPIVKAIVGPYQANKEQHRLCELAQDSLLYSELEDKSLRKGHMLDR